MSNRAKRHAHKYHHVDTSFGRVWACALPDCNHYMPQHMKELMLGKNSLCWSCGEKFLLTPINMRNDQPVCSNCDETSDGISELLKERLA